MCTALRQPANLAHERHSMFQNPPHWIFFKNSIQTINVPLCLQGYDILEDMYSPKTAAANLAHELCSKKKAHLDAFMGLMVQVRACRGAAAGAGPG